MGKPEKPRVEVERVPLVVRPRPFKITRYDSNGKVIKKYKLLDTLSDPMSALKRTEFYEKAKKAGNPLPLDSIKTRELLEDVAISGNSELQNYVYDSLRSYWIATTSVVEYNPKNQKDEVFHNWKTSDEYFLVGDIVGDNNYIDKINNPNALELLVGTKDVERLNKISNIIIRTPTFLWRYNSKSCEKVKCGVRFVAGDYRLGLYAVRDLSVEDPAFLVEQIK